MGFLLMVQSRPATLFYPVEYAMSPLVPVKEPDADDGAMEEPSRKSPVKMNDTPCTTETMENVPYLTMKQSSGRAHSTPTPSSNAEMDVIASAANGSAATESMLATSAANHSKGPGSPNIASHHSNVFNAPVV